MTPKKVKPLTADTKSHSKFQANMICSFGAILAWKSDAAADADDDYDDDCKSDPYMSPSYAGDTKMYLEDYIWPCFRYKFLHLCAMCLATE